MQVKSDSYSDDRKKKSALRAIKKKSSYLLFAPTLDPRLQKMAELAERAFCIYSEQAPVKCQMAEAEMPEFDGTDRGQKSRSSIEMHAITIQTGYSQKNRHS